MTAPDTRPTVPGNHQLSPDPGRLAALLVRTWLEVRWGNRPAAQLSPYVTPTVMARLRHQTTQVKRQRPIPTVRRVTARRPAPGVCEAVVTLSWASARVTSIAVRLEQHHGRWQAVEITPPESGFRPATAPSPPSLALVADAAAEMVLATASADVTHRGSA